MTAVAIDTDFTARDDPGLGPGARVYRFACAHGVSSALLFRGRRPLDDRVVLDMLLIGHHRSRGCACAPSLPEGDRLREVEPVSAPIPAFPLG